MKTLIQTLFFFLLVTQICFTQWYQQTGGTTLNLNSVSFYDSNNGMIVGDSGIILGTTNGGINWIVLPPNGNNNNLYSVHYKSGNWTAVGSEGTIIRNGNLQTSGTTNELQSVCFSDINNSWVVGGYFDDSLGVGSGIILHSTNGGLTWLPQLSIEGYMLNDVGFTDAENGTAVGSDFITGPIDCCGVILRTTNGGVTWTSLEWGNDWYGVSFIDEDNGTVVGGSDVIIRTTNGGIDWLVQYGGYPILRYLRDVSFIDINNVMAVEEQSAKILRTTDAGINWTEQSSGTTSWLRGVSFTDANNGWVVGSSGTILHTTNGGVSFVEEEQIDEVPSKFLLSQNYPNPFNPSTKIKYSVPQSTNIIIKVFDILGNEIETLVSEEKSVGSYEITWYAENLPSGVYFYQLRAGDFIQTRKMILLK